MRKIGTKHPEADKPKALVKKQKVNSLVPDGEKSPSGFLFSGLAFIGLGIAFLIKKAGGK